MGSHRSCTRSRLTPVEVRLSTAGEFARRPCSPRRLHGSALFCVFGFSLGASVRRSVRSVAPVQTGVPRLAGSTTALALCRKRNPFRRFHRPPPAICSRFAPLPHVRRSISPPQRCLCARHANGTSRAPADSTFPFPVSAAPGAAEPLHPSFSLSFPCPKSFSRSCC